MLLLRPAFGQGGHEHPHPNYQPREVVFPDIPGYETLSADLHIHTVFSDGSVWPDIRVQEAQRDNLDAIATTDHIEYQPHQDDIPHPDRNRAHEIASSQASDDELMVINGSEITRSMPPGHANAVFLQDANELLVDEAVASFREAKAQGAFIFWNHPSWLEQARDGLPPLSDMHETLMDDGLLHGIEVVNQQRYSKEALQIALEHDLTIVGTSDVHELIDWDYEVHDGGHRPVTLVFSEERSPSGLKEALFEGRTVVWKDDLLIGREKWLKPLIDASLSVSDVHYLDDTSVLRLEIENQTAQKYILRNESAYSLHHHGALVTVNPHGSTTLRVLTEERRDHVRVPFRVINAIMAPEQSPQIVLETEIQ